MLSNKFSPRDDHRRSETTTSKRHRRTEPHGKRISEPDGELSPVPPPAPEMEPREVTAIGGRRLRRTSARPAVRSSLAPAVRIGRKWRTVGTVRLRTVRNREGFRRKKATRNERDQWRETESLVIWLKVEERKTCFVRNFWINAKA